MIAKLVCAVALLCAAVSVVTLVVARIRGDRGPVFIFAPALAVSLALFAAGVAEVSS